MLIIDDYIYPSFKKSRLKIAERFKLALLKCQNNTITVGFFKGSVSRDFRPPVFFMMRTHLGP